MERCEKPTDDNEDHLMDAKILIHKKLFFRVPRRTVVYAYCGLDYWLIIDATSSYVEVIDSMRSHRYRETRVGMLDS